ncbi:MAG: ribonuclease H-like domain-containing protein, partial [Proteobacteria bacterium]|nr:ribonuclease H-like domain-containing protein [Pseudomonadota bacterium]MBU1709013.1 ribonuclease H-like domain-containing protein [Pseudomonadota bacterium]
QAWRIFPHFRNHSAYLDIETTAAYGFEQQITAITIYDGNKISCFVDGENLEDFEEAISRYKVLVTYNGKSFDAPIIEKHFRIKLPRAHIDLRYVLNHLGYSGGLKSCEKQLGMDRGLLEGVDGSFAIFLWEEFQRTGDRKALETLLAYNVADTVNLESLLIKAYNLNIEKTPFVQGQFIKDTIQPPSPYSPDPETVKKIKNDYFYR